MYCNKGKGRKRGGIFEFLAVHPPVIFLSYFSPWEQSLLQKAQLVRVMGAKNLLMISYQCQTGNEFGVLRQKRELNGRAYSTEDHT